jgi:DNA helicase-2/ATP-dependent DNA helicase PcrA
VIGREFERLNPMQREAVFRTEGPLLLLAGAGSGKTTVLINRVINLLRFGRAYYSGEVPAWIGDPEMETLAQAAAEPQSVPDAEISRLCAVDPPRPWEIIAITFTNKAAGELRDRLTTAWGPRRRRHLGLHLPLRLRAHPAPGHRPAGLDRSFTIYDTDDSQAADDRRILKELNLDEKSFPPRGVLARSSARQGRPAETPRILRQAQRGHGDDWRVQVARDLRRIPAPPVRAGALDFRRHHPPHVTLLQQDLSDDVREYYQRKFRYVLVDEYQDTNNLQYLLSSLLAGGWGNICVVGDDDQSIYRFRGATIENILSLRSSTKTAAPSAWSRTTAPPGTFWTRPTPSSATTWAARARPCGPRTPRARR